ncbi:hypothetical protein AmaxDRAFT_1755 [Limnospira maxima CS-328]|uniref:Uncharacterized protein n=1 Tax=Limnospira maxima CS-328 TaxID=513049 RepID=B5VZ17_LIMMA|nr:hypothetical protein AmaxDRAFT_1755 [Limnospira maxima CS-328]UWU51124.1 hypothetical protein APLC1_6084 [Arthrospira platensis C1]
MGCDLLAPLFRAPPSLITLPLNQPLHSEDYI